MAKADRSAGTDERGILAPLAEVIAHRIDEERHGTVVPRDPGFVRRFVPHVEQWMRYFSPEVRGIENLPVTGPVLVVSNHSCLFYMPDTWMVGAAITERRGADAPAYAMVYDLLFGIPAVGSSLRRLGAVPASGGEGERLLAEGALILDYPGGDAEACRPWAERDKIIFSGHMACVWPCVPASQSSPWWLTAATTPSWCCPGGRPSHVPSGWPACGSRCSRSSSGRWASPRP